MLELAHERVGDARLLDQLQHERAEVVEGNDDGEERRGRGAVPARSWSARAVVHAHELGPAAALADDLVEHRHGSVGVAAAGDLGRKRLSGVLVDDVQQPQYAAVADRVELKVELLR